MDRGLHGGDFLAQRLASRRPHAHEVGYVKRPRESAAQGLDLALFLRSATSNDARVFSAYSPRSRSAAFSSRWISWRGRGRRHV